ncbi:MAG: PD-(D/E)XK nuclease family protein [Planctomycetaceae bacterium]
MPVQRHFIDWKQPLLPAVADYLIHRYATEAAFDLRHVVMVFTGRRASRRMLELLFERASPKWPAFVPPRMVTFQQFPEMLYRPQTRFAEDLTQLLIWKKAISSIPAKELEAALPSIPDNDAIPAWLALCESLRAQHNELAEEGIEFDAVQAALERAGNRQEAERWQALRRIQSEYLMQMDNLGLWDRQASRLIAVEKRECEVDFDIILVGTVDMNRVVQQMLDQVADAVTSIIHAPESEADAFDCYGCLLVDRWTDRRLNIDPEATRIANRPEDQATFVVQELAAFGASWRPDEITIGIADDTLVPVVLQKLSDAGISGRWPVGMQLKDSRPWRLLNGIVDHLGSSRHGQPPDFATMSDLVRHPDVTAWVDRQLQHCGVVNAGTVDWLTELDNYVARHLQTGPGVLLGTKSRRELVGAIIAAVNSLLAPLCPFEVNTNSEHPSSHDSSRQRQLTFDDQPEVPQHSLHHQLESRRPLNEWAAGVLRLLQAVYGNYELQPDLPRDKGIMACCEQLADAAQVLRHVPADVMLRCTASQALQFLLREIGDAAIPSATDDQAIDLLGWLELAMADAPVLLLTGFNEGCVPESVTSDVFLPNSLRTELKLRDNRRRYARDAYAVTALLHSRDKLVFISGRADAKGNPLTPSRLWFAAEPTSLPERVRRFYDADCDQTSPVAGSLPAMSVSDSAAEGSGRLSGFTVPCPTMVPKAPAEIPVTAFREYLQCPYRYFLKRELKLKVIDDETRELAAPAFGSLIHDVLNDFGDSDLVNATTPRAIEDFLLRTLQKQALQRFGRTRSATVAVQLQMVENRLQAFAAWQAQTASEGWRVEFTEESLKYADFRDVKGRSVVLAGRVDRIDRNRFTGQWRVLDYKTSERADRPEATHFKKDEWVDLQLPLYRLLVRSLEFDSEIQLGYVHLPGNLAQVGASIAKWTEADLLSAERTAQQVAADILDLKIDRVEPGQDNRSTEFARVCQDTVIDRNIPWLEHWTGRP